MMNNPMRSIWRTSSRLSPKYCTRTMVKAMLRIDKSATRKLIDKHADEISLTCCLLEIPARKFLDSLKHPFTLSISRLIIFFLVLILVASLSVCDLQPLSVHDPY
jgi:hypothetical protein